MSHDNGNFCKRSWIIDGLDGRTSGDDEYKVWDFGKHACNKFKFAELQSELRPLFAPQEKKR